MPAKRKRSSIAEAISNDVHETPILPPSTTSNSTNIPNDKIPILPLKLQKVNRPAPKHRRQSTRGGKIDTNPDHDTGIVDGKTALRASPDADEKGEAFDTKKVGKSMTVTPAKLNGVKNGIELEDSDSSLSEIEEPPANTPAKKRKKTPTKSSIAAKKGSDEIKAFMAEQATKKAAEAKFKKENGEEDEWEKRGDPDVDDDGLAEDIDVMKQEARRPPPVNSDYLPLPWKGRLGYACLNTYLRFSTPPIFSSRTCRIASILEHRHPLKDPLQPEHSTKNRPDKTQPASVERGKRYLEEICLANVGDIPKMLRWNDKYGIKFMRLSSEMFPFASHAEYGYKLAPFAAEALAEAGKAAAKLGHRLSTHPGQFTQLGSPRPEVISNAIRDLEYHDEMLSLLKLPLQQDRDAVMILHMGGTFGDQKATISRFRSNYQTLSPSIKRRLVLENDDVSYSVHDLLPICEELNIPLCLDFHHHNIIFNPSLIREGTRDITSLFPRIKATWDRKNITQKMHYSEQTPQAVTGRQRRKHNPRPKILPPCANDMDLMIEAKDKEQAVFELMRTFKLPGWDTFNDIVPYERDDDNRVVPKKAKTKKTKKQIAAEIEEFGRELSEVEEPEKDLVPIEEVAMGGRENRVYWPVGMEEWLKPKKRQVKKKAKQGEDEEGIFKNPTPENFEARKKITANRRAPLSESAKEKLVKAGNAEDIRKVLDEIRAEQEIAEEYYGEEEDERLAKKIVPAKKKAEKKMAEPVVENMEEEEDLSMPDLSDDETDLARTAMRAVPTRQSGRAVARKRKSYTEVEDEDE